VADGGQLYQRHKDGAVWRSVGSPNWELIDANSSTVEITADAGKVFQRHGGGQVWVYTGAPGNWQQLDGNPNTVALASNVARR
jgi:hypothetical protein